MPSPFIDIMMLRPSLRTFQIALWNAASVASTTEPGWPRSPINSTSAFSRRRLSAGSSPANSVSRIACGSPWTKRSTIGRNTGLARDNSIIVRSTSSTADGPSLTMCCGASIAL